jgi:hypothetical protein
MFHHGFRPRLPVQNNLPAGPRNEGVDVPELHMLVGTALDEQLTLGREPAEVSDEMAALLSAAIQRRQPSEVHDSFAIYAELLPASPFVLRDIYNHLLADEDQHWVEDPDLTRSLTQTSG